MGQILSDITKTIGNTPLVELKHLSPTGGARIVAKVESFNPLSSVKDRIGLSMIDAAEQAGAARPGETTLVEPTSGNTGIGLASAAAAKKWPRLSQCRAFSLPTRRRYASWTRAVGWSV